MKPLALSALLLLFPAQAQSDDRCTLSVTTTIYPEWVAATFVGDWTLPVCTAGLTDGGQAGPIRSETVHRGQRVTWLYMRPAEGQEQLTLFGFLSVVDGLDRCDVLTEFVVPPRGTDRQ